MDKRIFAGLVLVSLLIICTSYGDMIRFSDGTIADGKVIALSRGEFHIQIDDEEKIYPLEEVDSFMISPGETEISEGEEENSEFMIIQNSLQTVLMRLERLEQLMYTQTDNIRTDLFDLQPESKLGVNGIKGEFDKKRELFRMTGFLYSTAQELVLNPVLNIQFLDYYEQVVAEYKYRFTQTSISPNNRFAFKINFTDLPQFHTFKVTPGVDLEAPTTLVPKQLERIR